MKVKIFKRKKGFKKGGVHVDPALYWGISLWVSLLVVMASAVFGFYLFQKVNQGLVREDAESAHTQSITKERIDKALQYFSLREQKSAEILNSPSPVIDPSL